MKRPFRLDHGALRRAFRLVALALIAASVARSAGSVQGPPTDIPANPSRLGAVGMAAFTNIADLPFLREGVATRQFAAYDRAGDNYDHEFRYWIYSRR